MADITSPDFCSEHINWISEAAMLVAPLWKVPWRGLVSRERFPFLPTPSFKRTFKTNTHMRRQFKERNGLFNKDGRHGSCIDVLCFPSSIFSGRVFPWGKIWARACFHPGASGLPRDDAGLEAARKVTDFTSLADLHISHWFHRWQEKRWWRWWLDTFGQVENLKLKRESPWRESFSLEQRSLT